MDFYVRSGSRSRHKILFLLVWPWLVWPLLRATDVPSGKAVPDIGGIAWNVRGAWHVDAEDAPILTGDAIQAGALLEPGEGEPNHSITILLPDGQEILDECFSAKDCARGFRVPELQSDPSPFVIQLIGRIRAVLVEQRDHSPLVPAAPSPAGRDEAAAVLKADDRIEISGLAAALLDGRYVYDLTPIHSAYPPQTGVPLEKAGRSIELEVPGPGLYSVRIIDTLKNPRIDYLIAAVRPGEGDAIAGDYEKAHALFKEWREDYQGWPMHEFQRAYLEALMLNIPAAVKVTRAPQGITGARSSATAEPVFSPKPGVSNGNMEISLRSATRGAVIHYTIDGAQPLDSSPVYRTPIVVKGRPIGIKAFAESPGKKDSAVVTGIFRIQGQED